LRGQYVQRIKRFDKVNNAFQFLKNMIEHGHCQIISRNYKSKNRYL